MNNDESQLCIVLPVHNEATSVEKVLMTHYEKILCRIQSSLVVAEDGSTDGTREILLRLKEKIPMKLLLSRERMGYGRAVRNLLKGVDSEWVFFSDSDGQYSATDFWSLWKSRQAYDMVIGRKTHRRDAAYRIVLAKGFHQILNFLFRLDLHDADCGFRLIRRKTIESVVDDVEFLKYSFWAEFTIRACLKGFRTGEVPITHMLRDNGATRIYKRSKLPLIILSQFEGLARLYRNLMGNHLPG